jgi:site-specific DNA-methyltransferase (adenine-specific)
MAVLYLGDCLEKIKCVSDKSVDLIICDLPFGCLTGGGIITTPSNTYGGNGCSWDIKIDLVEFWKQIKRIRKNDHTPCLLFTTTRYGFDLYNSNPKEFRYDLVWDKQRGVSFLSANKMPMRSHEMIYVFSKLGANYNRIDIEGDFKNTISPNHKRSNISNVIPKVKDIPSSNEGKRCILSVINNVNKIGKGKHPTEKPLDLYKFLIERYSNKDDVVLDPTFGSGNSGIACKELERKYIGIEKDNNFFWKYVGKI